MLLKWKELLPRQLAGRSCGPRCSVCVGAYLFAPSVHWNNHQRTLAWCLAAASETMHGMLCMCVCAFLCALSRACVLLSRAKRATRMPLNGVRARSYVCACGHVCVCVRAGGHVCVLGGGGCVCVRVCVRAVELACVP